MAFEINFIREPVTDRVLISCHDVEGAGHSLAAGEWIQVRIGTLESPVTLLQEQVPVGKAWSEIHFQFQAREEAL